MYIYLYIIVKVALHSSSAKYDTYIHVSVYYIYIEVRTHIDIQIYFIIYRIYLYVSIHIKTVPVYTLHIYI